MEKQQRRRDDGIWKYLPLEEAIKEVGLEEIEMYISRRQNTVALYIATRHIFDMCLEAARCKGSWVMGRW